MLCLWSGLLTGADIILASILGHKGRCLLVYDMLHTSHLLLKLNNSQLSTHFTNIL